MVRRGQGRQQSLNSSIVTVGNNSILDEGDRAPEVDYAEFIKRFGRPDLAEESKTKLVGYEKTIEAVESKIDQLLSGKHQDFALITGPSGTGKTTAVRRLAEKHANVKDEKKRLTFFYLKSSWTLEKQFGNPETRLRLIFDEAVQKSPSLIFIDKIDLICSEKRSQNDAKDRVFNVLEDKLESLKCLSAKVLVLAATDRPEVLDSQIKKPSYFSDEIRFTLPDQQDRVHILKHILTDYKHSLSSEQIEQVARASHCYSFRDLSKLCNSALIIRQKQADKTPAELDLNSLKRAQSEFKPAAIRSITTPCPPLRWEDIGGVDDVKKELQESVIWPLEHRDKFQRLGIRSNKGAILYGPPGCSKTMLAQALATESGYNFISVKGPELFSKYVGDSEAAVRKLYKNAREIAPCIIFFDEIDGFAPERNDNQSSSVGDKVVAQLLTELNGIEPLDNVYTIAATNRPDRVDGALLRPGRLDPAIYIPLPSDKDRRAIFHVHMKPLSLNFADPLDEVQTKLAKLTENYSGAEIANVCRVAGTLALRESLSNEHIEWKHFEEALSKVKPRTKIEQLKAYEIFQERSLQSGNTGARSSQPAIESKKPTTESSHNQPTGDQAAPSSPITNGTSGDTNELAPTKRHSDMDIESLSDEAKSIKGKKRFDLDKLMRSLRLKKKTTVEE